MSEKISHVIAQVDGVLPSLNLFMVGFLVQTTRPNGGYNHVMNNGKAKLLIPLLINNIM